MRTRLASHRSTARSATLVAADPLTQILHSFWLATILMLKIVGWAAVLCASIAVLYLVKSALGIDLLPGPSPLHDLLFPLIRR